jgi:CBS domain-containing protein
MMQGLRVRHALPMRTVRPVAVDDTLADVMALGLGHNQRDFPVVRENVLVGILSRDDLLAAIQCGGGSMYAEQAMRSDFPSVSPDDPLLRAQQLMAQVSLSALPVFDQGHFLDLISLEDINRAYANLSWRRR